MTAMNSIGDKTIGFDDDSGAETLEGPTDQLEVGGLEGLIEDDEIDQEEHLGGADGPGQFSSSPPHSGPCVSHYSLSPLQEHGVADGGPDSLILNSC